MGVPHLAQASDSRHEGILALVLNGVDGAQHQVCQGSVGLAQILPRFPVGGNPKGPWGLAGNPEGPAAALSRTRPLATDPLCALGQTDSLLHLVVYFIPTLFCVRNKCYIPVA